jgi:hypothetical protein
MTTGSSSAFGLHFVFDVFHRGISFSLVPLQHQLFGELP